MKILLLISTCILILIHYSYNRFANTCPLFKCDTKKEVTESNVCMKASNNTLAKEMTYLFKDCVDPDTFCDFDTSKEYKNNEVAYCKLRQEESGLKGYNKKCKEDSECLTGVCKKNKCTGKLLYESCSRDEICSHELYCLPSNNTCVKVKPDDTIPKEKINDDMLKCNSTVECAYDRECIDGKCQIPFILDDGKEVNDKRLCKSNNFLNQTRSDGSEYYVCDRFLLQNTTYDCNDEQEFCTYKYNYTKTSFTLPCLCSKTETQKRRCPPDQSNDRINEQSYNSITISDENTVYRNINNWNQLNFKQYYPNLDMSQCVADVLDKNSNYLRMISLLSLLLLSLFVM